jgi:hypothetical protein
VVAFCVYKIAGIFDENVVEEFFTEVGDPEDLPEGSPVTALHKVLRADLKSEDPMSKHQILGYVIKAFNAWKRGDSVKKLSFRLDEDFPVFIENQDPPQEQAA